MDTGKGLPVWWRISPPSVRITGTSTSTSCLTLGLVPVLDQGENDHSCRLSKLFR